MASVATPSRRIRPKNALRDLLIGALGGAVVLALLVFGIMQMGHESGGNWATGKVVSKEYTSKPPETEVSFGKAGVQQKTTDGEYTVKVFVASENRTYDVLVGKKDFEAATVGKDFRFLR